MSLEKVYLFTRRPCQCDRFIIAARIIVPMLGGARASINKFIAGNVNKITSTRYAPRSSLSFEWKPQLYLVHARKNNTRWGKYTIMRWDSDHDMIAAGGWVFCVCLYTHTTVPQCIINCRINLLRSLPSVFIAARPLFHFSIGSATLQLQTDTDERFSLSDVCAFFFCPLNVCVSINLC